MVLAQLGTRDADHVPDVPSRVSMGAYRGSTSSTTALRRRSRPLRAESLPRAGMVPLAAALRAPRRAEQRLLPNACAVRGRSAARMGESSRGNKVLIVDDDEQQLKLTARILQRAGYQVVTRSDVIGTSLSVASEKPDLVLIDLDMPLIRGDRLASMILRAIPDRPILVLFSGIDEKMLERRAAECGADDAIPKGLSPQRFLERVSRVMSRSRATSPRAKPEA
jgi:PleD family two-component response regulator